MISCMYVRGKSPWPSADSGCKFHVCLYSFSSIESPLSGIDKKLLHFLLSAWMIIVSIHLTSIPEAASIQPAVHPNPTTGHLLILNNGIPAQHIISDIHNRYIKTIESEKETDVNDLAPGMYFLLSAGINSAQVIRVIKE